MEELEPNTPVIVGVGSFQEKKDDPLECLEPYQLMVQAVRNAAEDAGSSSLLTQIDSISVMHGFWDYPNPGKLIADTLGCPSAKSVLAELGVQRVFHNVRLKPGKPLWFGVLSKGNGQVCGTLSRSL